MSVYQNQHQPLSLQQAKLVLSPLCSVEATSSQSDNFYFASFFKEINDGVGHMTTGISNATCIGVKSEISTVFFVYCKGGLTKGTLDGHEVSFVKDDYYCLSPSIQWRLEYYDVDHEALAIAFPKFKLEFRQFQIRYIKLLTAIGWNGFKSLAELEDGPRVIIELMTRERAGKIRLDGKVALKYFSNVQNGDFQFNQIAVDLGLTPAAISKCKDGPTGIILNALRSHKASRKARNKLSER